MKKNYGIEVWEDNNALLFKKTNINNPDLAIKFAKKYIKTNKLNNTDYIEILLLQDDEVIDVKTLDDIGF